MKTGWGRHWPLIMAVGVLSIVVIGVFALCLRADGGRFVYAIDDIYIAMPWQELCCARGVGVTPTSSAPTSPQSSGRCCSLYHTFWGSE